MKEGLPSTTAIDRHGGHGLRRPGRVHAATTTSAHASILWINYPKFTVQVGARPRTNFLIRARTGTPRLTTASRGAPGQGPSLDGAVPVTVSRYDVAAFAVNVTGRLRTNNAAYLAKWQLQTYEKICAAYQALQTAYDQKVTQAEAAAGIAIQGHNPRPNRVTRARPS